MNKAKWMTAEISAQVESILSAMTLEEKVGQMTQYDWNSVSINPEAGDEHRKRMLEHWERGIVGSLFNLSGVEEVNQLQEQAMRRSRLSIPMLIGRDVIHGYRSVFPIPLGMSSSWNPDLIGHAAAAASYEASADGISWVFAPMVDISRDPRWGRIAETAGEDPYLTSRFAKAWVEGAERNNWLDTLPVASCPKHFAGYGLAEAGRDYNSVDVSDRTLREVILPPFQSAVEAGALSIMASFNELNGIPACANRYLLTTILREEWGFEGIVVSDYYALKELIVHGIAANEEEACLLSIQAGTDMDMHSGIYMEYLPKLIGEGRVPEELVDQAVRRILAVKVKLGLFERNRVDPSLRKGILLSDAHRRMARQAARESIILLENRKQTLPLPSSLKSIAVIGPLADNSTDPLGCWAMDGRPEDVVSVLAGLKGAVGSDTEILYALGCSMEADPEKDSGLIREALDVAALADSVILVVGESLLMSGEGNSRAELDLPGRQRELVEALAGSGKPLVVVLLNGRPLTVNWMRDAADAVLEAWHPGIECGTAIADVVFGSYNPSGKLTATFPMTTGQIPIYHYRKSTGRPSGGPYTSRYCDATTDPLYPFGYGLSYTTFHYAHLTLSSRQIGPEDVLQAAVEVKNTGSMAGEEIVQLYVRDLVGSVVQPVKRLKGFMKIMLQPGEARTVTLSVQASELAIIGAEGKLAIEPGAFELWIGPNSREGLKECFEIA
jgi:beta-glucosidase